MKLVHEQIRTQIFHKIYTPAYSQVHGTVINIVLNQLYDNVKYPVGRNQTIIKVLYNYEIK
jgi:hypothetical protein